MAVYKKSKTYKKLNTAAMNAINAEAVSSSQLSIKIAEFLQRTDHVADEWKKIGKEDKKKQYNDIGKKIDHYFRNLKKHPTKDNLDGQNELGDVKSVQQVHTHVDVAIIGEDSEPAKVPDRKKVLIRNALTEVLLHRCISIRWWKKIQREVWGDSIRHVERIV